MVPSPILLSIRAVPPDWRSLTVTGKARSAIRRHIRQTEKEEFLRLGKAALFQSFERVGKSRTGVSLRPAVERLGVASDDELYDALGRGRITPMQVMEIVFPGLDETARAAAVARRTIEDGQGARAVKNAASLYALAMEAADGGKSLKAVIEAHGYGEAIDLEKAYAEGRLISPITHPDPAHLHLTGTGLTHLGSAATRDAMHKKTTEAAAETLTDSMKMFRMGLEGGKPKPGEQRRCAALFVTGRRVSRLTIHVGAASICGHRCSVASSPA